MFVILQNGVKTWEELFGTKPWRLLRFAVASDTRWSAFNPSIACSDMGEPWMLLRSSNYFLDPDTTSAVLTTNDNMVKTRLWLGKLDKNLESVITESLVELGYSDAGIDITRGPEDGRLYWANGGWEFTAGLREPSLPLPRIGRFRIKENKIYLIKVYNSGSLYDVEKNWAGTSDSSGNFDYIYNPISIYVDGVGPVKVKEASPQVRDVRGGTQLAPLGDETYLSVIHEAIVKDIYMYIPRYFTYKNVPVRKYLHRFARYSVDGVLIGLSPTFTFSNARIEFAAGLIIKDKMVYVSYGHQDAAAHVAKVELNKVLELIVDV